MTDREKELGYPLNVVVPDTRDRSKQNVICIGYRFKGGSLVREANYVFNHANYWNHSKRKEELEVMTKARLLIFLKDNKTNLRELLREALKRQGVR